MPPRGRTWTCRLGRWPLGDLGLDRVEFGFAYRDFGRFRRVSAGLRGACAARGARVGVVGSWVGSGRTLELAGLVDFGVSAGAVAGRFSGALRWMRRVFGGVVP